MSTRHTAAPGTPLARAATAPDSPGTSDAPTAPLIPGQHSAQATPDAPGPHTPASECTRTDLPLLGARGITMVVPGPSGPRTILNKLDLELSAGEIVCATGRTGCGKSTLLRIVAGTLTPQSGTVTWETWQVDWKRPEAIARHRSGFLGYLPQDNPVIDGLTTLDNIMLGAGPIPHRRRQEAREQATALASRLGLDAVLNHEVSTLSGGERQRTGLCRLLLARPRVLVLDEPTSALDGATARLLISILREQADAGTTVLAATHDPLLMEAATRNHPLDQTA